jgi:hypothetical protein
MWHKETRGTATDNIFVTYATEMWTVQRAQHPVKVDIFVAYAPEMSTEWPGLPPSARASAGLGGNRDAGAANAVVVTLLYP